MTHLLLSLCPATRGSRSAAELPWRRPDVERLFRAAADNGITAGIDRPLAPGAAFSVLWSIDTDRDSLASLPALVRRHLRSYKTGIETIDARSRRDLARRTALSTDFYPVAA